MDIFEGNFKHVYENIQYVKAYSTLPLDSKLNFDPSAGDLSNMQPSAQSLIYINEHFLKIQSWLFYVFFVF